MTALNKQARQVQRYANFGVDMMEWVDGGYVKYSDYLALLDELEESEGLRLKFQAANCELRQKLEAAEKRIAELRDWNAGLAQESFTYQQRVAELEVRTVKLPKLKMLSDYLAEVTEREREDILLGVKLEFHRVLAAAGIGVKGE